MNVYFAGIGGVGLGPLAMLVSDAGYSVQGSDTTHGLMTDSLEARGISIIYQQDGSGLEATHAKSPLDMVVYSAALPSSHPELIKARELGISTVKRDILINHIIAEKNLKLIAVAGTHGKTSTTGMIVWLARYFGMPVSYLLGTTTSWCPSGAFHAGSEYFIYECDEFDRNFLAFHPFASLITSMEHDHPDTYPTEADYFAAFSQFVQQSNQTIAWQTDVEKLTDTDNQNVKTVAEINPMLRVAGEHNRRNGTLILEALQLFGLPAKFAADGLNKFPGTQRRFEQLARNLYTDYGHTPTEIQATLQMASELSDKVVLVYQPHQNARQHKIQSQYTDDIFANADRVYWLPTYLSREHSELEILTPADLTKQLKNTAYHIAEMNDELRNIISEAIDSGALVLGMGAGSIDGWLRDQSF